MKSVNLFTLLMIAMCAVLVGITGCDSDNDDSSTSANGGLPGSWTLNAGTVTAPLVGENAAILSLGGVDVSGNTMSVDASFLNLFGIAVTLIIDGDGTWAVQATVPSVPGFVDAGSYTAEGTYTVSGNRLTFVTTSVPAEAAGLLNVGDTYTISYTQSGNALNLSASSADLGVEGVSGSFDFTR